MDNVYTDNRGSTWDQCPIGPLNVVCENAPATFDLLAPARRAIALPAHDQAALDARVALADSEARIDRNTRRRVSALRGEDLRVLMSQAPTGR